MDTANDAKFGKICIGPIFFPTTSRIFFILILFFVSFLFSKEKNYQVDDISIVSEKLFEYHIDQKGFNEKLVKRLLKIFIDDFDPYKIYLNEVEVLKIMNIKSKKIVKNLNRNDYNDFKKIFIIFNKAVLNAKGNREKLKDAFLKATVSQGNYNDSYKKNLFFPKNDQQLYKFQKEHFTAFYNAQKKNSDIDSFDKKLKVFELYEKKVGSAEKLFLLSNDERKNEHNFVLFFLKAFSKSLDAHTYFFSDEEAKEMRVNLEKKFEGIGVILTETIDGVVITDIIENSPAYENDKVKKGDIIVEINNTNVQGFSFKEVLEKMKEKENGVLSLGLRRQQTDKIIYVDLASRPIEIMADRVSSEYEKVDDGIIVTLTLNSFYENGDGCSAEEDLKKAISDAYKVGNVKGIVLDLRENAGGFLSQAVKVAGIFLSNGVVVMSKYSDGAIRYLRTIKSSPFYSGPLVILTSKLSASAAEIVAQALQDYGVGIVVGDRRTFGKGSIQYQTVTNPNASYFYKVTIGRYYTVSGKSTQINGVIADIVVPSKYKPFPFGERYLEYALLSDEINSAYDDDLGDLEPRLKRLFEKKYIPFLQQKQNHWNAVLPELAKRSKNRITKDEFYHKFINEKINLDSLNNIEKGNYFKRIDQFQLNEAIYILKDMIDLSNSQNFNTSFHFKKAE